VNVTTSIVRRQKGGAQRVWNVLALNRLAAQANA
jgi:hypothetical protein